MLANRSLSWLPLAVALGGSIVGLPPAQGQSGVVVVPPNPFCRLGGCGFGRDGIPQPYGGRGITRLPVRAGVAADNLLGFAARRMSFLSWMTGADITGVPTNASDIWGYTSPAGREYAIVGLKTGTAFVEITSPTSPRVAAMVEGPNSDWRDMAVYRQFAYSVNEHGGGMQVIDLRGIDEGRVPAPTSLTQMGLATAHNIYVNEDSGRAYLLGSNLARGGLLVADLADPANPVLEPVAWNAAYVHDVQVVTYPRGRYRGREIVFAFTGPLGLHIIDVTDPARPATLSHLVYENATYGHSGALSPDRKFLYVNDELDERLDPDVNRMTTYIVRVRDLERPRLVRAIRWDLQSIDHNSMVQGDTLYLSSYTAGVRVLDISEPRKPRVGGYFDTYPADDATRFAGAWGIFAGFPSGNIVVSDIERGLFVLHPR